MILCRFGHFLEFFLKPPCRTDSRAELRPESRAESRNQSRATSRSASIDREESQQNPPRSRGQQASTPLSAPKQRSWFNQLVSGLSNTLNQATNQPNNFNQYPKQRGNSQYSQYTQNDHMSQNNTRNYDQRYQNGQNIQASVQSPYTQNEVIRGQNSPSTDTAPQSQQYSHQSNQYLQHSTRNAVEQTGHVTQHSTRHAEAQPNQPQNLGPACQTTVDVEKVTIQFDDRSFSAIKASLMTSLLSLNQITHTMTRPNHFLCEYKSSRQTASVFSKTTKFSIEIVEKGGLDIYRMVF